MNLLRKISIVSVVLAALYAFSVKPAVLPTSGATGIFSVADNKPLFNGKPAETEFRKYVAKTIVYPAKAYQDGITGRVFVVFIVETDGSVTNAKVLSSTNPLFDAEVLRVIKSSPKWTPGKLNGKAERVTYALAVNFELVEKTQPASSSNTVELPKYVHLLEEVTVVGYEAQRISIAIPCEDTKSEDKAAAKTETVKKPAYQFVEQMPEFPGGEEAFREFLFKNLVYPPEAQQNGIQGTVYASFFVEVDGSISDATVVRGIDPLCDDEALRIINLMPNWIPGRQNGKAVRVKFTLPIKFPPEPVNKPSATSPTVKRGKTAK